MSGRSADDYEILPNLFRLEYTKMTAVLCRHFGLQHIETAEDIASETFLKALESWAINGLPENPVAWLYTVAKNKAKDHFKREKIFEEKIRPAVKAENYIAQDVFDFTPQFISDSQLVIIFAVCDPAISPEDQVCLALQLLCGFSIQEIADAFLTKTETIKKRVQRARAKLLRLNFQIGQLSKELIQSRLDTVLKTLYLLFNEGYFSRSNNIPIRKSLCAEAIRLGLILTGNTLTNTKQTNALLALFCYQSSRLHARIDAKGQSILFEQQDKALWDKELIDRGNYFLVNACSGKEISSYHLEAGIAYWHTVPAGSEKWTFILQLYNQLLLTQYSPIAAINRTFAYAKVHGCTEALQEAEKLGLVACGDYYALLGYLNAEINPGTAIAHYKKAIQLTRSGAEKKTLAKEMERLFLRQASTESPQ